MITIATIATYFVAAFVGASAKFVFDQAMNSRCTRRRNAATVVREMSVLENGLINLNPSNVIPFERIEEEISYALNESVNGGMWIFGTPSGTGKSTYLDKCIKKFRAENPERYVVLFHTGIAILTNGGLHAQFGVPLNESLSGYIPQGTIIVIDQVDCFTENLSLQTKDYLLQLATTSYNSKSFSIIVSVSKPSVMMALLKLNGYEKIRDLCDPLFAKWTIIEARAYVNMLFQSWSEDEKEELIMACNNTYSPSVLHQACSFSKKKKNNKKEVRNCVKLWSSQKAKEWEEYAIEFKDFAFYTPFVNGTNS